MMSPGLERLEMDQVSVKRISRTETVEGVCHVGAGSPPKPAPLIYVKMASSSTPPPADDKSRSHRRKSSNCSIASQSSLESIPEQSQNHSSGLSPATRQRKFSHGSKANKTSTESNNSSSRLLAPPDGVLSRRATVGTCSSDKSPLVRARNSLQRRKKAAAATAADDQSQHSSNNSSQETLQHEYRYDPVKVTNLDIDTGSYLPDPDRIDFLKKALSVSHDPFLIDVKRDRAASFTTRTVSK